MQSQAQQEVMISQIQSENEKHLGHVRYDSMELNDEMEWRRNETARNKDFSFLFYQVSANGIE